MSGFPSAPVRLLTQTPAAGFALQNGTPTILSWTAPHDGQLHWVICVAELDVTSAETGGQVNVETSVNNAEVMPGGQGSGYQWFNQNAGKGIIVHPGDTVSVVQQTALTAGAATVFAALFGA
jgi:hypothetical protein